MSNNYVIIDTTTYQCVTFINGDKCSTSDNSTRALKFSKRTAESHVRRLQLNLEFLKYKVCKLRGN